MPYVVAYHHYYPSGGFDDVKFEGDMADCEEVATALRDQGRYDVVEVVSGYVNTDKYRFVN
ncbi:hypothetical protein PMW_154 [Pseudomonas phage phiPMW]|uniref:Uncharacterized protein n=1 Tax=Pseudomonas phage phiPMW TaxID=1815582 RepID=A0A1S5R1K2_9CAUD|nr:hypothetical protein FDG97_gp196 [Pseudomonas phage phiPMW]ANA49279.1 hypothetical protein PMW_154 [Pseudomonas phage phiPMW]